MQQPKARMASTGAILMGVGGLIALIGSVLAWVKVASIRPLLAAVVGSRTVAGTSSGEGKAVLVMGIIAVAAAVLAVAVPRREVVIALGIVAIVAALVVLFFTVRDIGEKNLQIRDAIQSETGRRFTDAQVRAYLQLLGITISLGVGIYISMLGGLVMLGGGIATIATAPKEEAGSSFDAGMVSAAPTYSPPAPPEVIPPTMPAPGPDSDPDTGTIPG